MSCHLSLAGLLLLGHCLIGATEAGHLPPVALHIAADGAWVEHSGSLPAGADRISGLPAGIDRDSVALTDADGRRLEWRWLPPTPPTATGTAPDPETEHQQTDERRRLLAALEAAAMRRGLAAQSRPVEGDQDEALGALLGADDLAALLAFHGEQARQAAQAEQQARAALQRLAQADAASPATADSDSDALGAGLQLAAAPSGELRLAYRLPGWYWRPHYRLRLDGDEARLQGLAAITAAAPADWPAVELSLSNARLLPTPRRIALAQRRLAPVSGLHGWGQHHGKEEDEQLLDPSLRDFRLRQNADGSWGEGAARQLSTGLVCLCYLGSGYDHRTPSQYQQSVDQGLAFLRQRQPGQLALIPLAITTAALAEAQAMTKDPHLRPWLFRAIEELDASLADGRLLAALQSDRPLHGPIALFWTTLATKSCQAGGIDTVDLLERLDTWRARGLPGPALEAGVAEAICAVFLGHRQPYPIWREQAVQRWPSEALGWIDRGESFYAYAAALATFQFGGEPWQRWANDVRPLIVDRLADGPIPAGGSTSLIQRALLVLSLEIYYRYAPVTAGVPSSSGQPIAYRWQSDRPVRLRSGTTQVALDALPLEARFNYSARPQVDKRVYRRLQARNPSPSGLPAGRVQLLVDGLPAGDARLATTLPGASFSMAIGPVPRLRLDRRYSEASDDNWIGTRTTEATIAYQLLGAADWSAPIEISEALPQPEQVAGGIDWRLLEPALEDDDLAACRQAGRITWRWDPQRPTPLRWQVRHPAKVRPEMQLETAP